MDTKLKSALDELDRAPKTDIKGKKYSTVATRISIFRRNYGHEYGLTTEVMPSTDGLIRVRAIITTGERVIATGMAEERRGSSAITKTSALEVCETSAIGRALANFGLGGSEFASADEVANAIGQTKEIKLTDLKVQFKNAVDELHACSDEGGLVAFLNADQTIELLENLRNYVPKWIHGGGDVPSWDQRVQEIRDGFVDTDERAAIEAEIPNHTPLSAG